MMGARMATPRRTVAMVSAQAGMELRLLVRAAESLVVTFGIPLGILIFFSSVDVLPTGDLAPIAFLVPGVLAISIAATGLVAVAIQTAFERKYGVLKRLGSTPLTTTGFLAAKAVAVMALIAVQATLVFAVAVPMGWRPPVGLATLTVAAATVGSLALGALACTSLGLLMAGTLRAEATLAASNALFLVLMVISGVAFDVAALPDALSAVGLLLPLGALGQLLRSILAEGAVHAVSAAVLAGWSVLGLAAGHRWFRWEP